MLWFVKLYKSFVEKKASIHEKYSPIENRLNTTLTLREVISVSLQNFQPFSFLKKSITLNVQNI